MSVLYVEYNFDINFMKIIILLLIIFQWIWLLVPNSVIWSIEKIDPQYKAKSRFMYTNIVDKKISIDDFLEKHEGYLLFSISNVIYKSRNGWNFVFVILGFLFCTIALYNLQVDLSEVNSSFGRLMSLLYKINKTAIITIIIIDVAWNYQGNQNIFWST